MGDQHTDEQRTLHTVDLIEFQNPSPYREIYALQVTRRKAVEDGRVSNALFLLEHTPVYTLGRNAHEEHLLTDKLELKHAKIDVCNVDRGGDITYHGPGQLVAYPILNLNEWRLSIDWYLRTLEDVLIDLLADYDLHGERIEGLTGVWVGGAKVAAIGIAIKQWVTYHGIAINVDPNMDHWGQIVPCGIPDKPVTSLKELLGTAPAMSEVGDRFKNHFAQRFSVQFDSR